MSSPFSRSLPPRPDIAQQKKQAKELRESFTAGDAESRARVHAALPDKQHIALADAHPDRDPKAVNFVDLYKWVMALPGFDDDPKRCGEKILEAIQTAWIEEAE